MKRVILAPCLSLILAAAAPAALAREEPDSAPGVNAEKMSALRNLVPAERLEAQADEQYSALKAQARQKGLLVPASDPQVQRLQRIANALIPHATRWNPRASDWKWEISLIATGDVNAFCMPGGKIAFFGGLISKLKLTDDEIAIVMGHEIAHALREHGRERMAKGTLLNLGAALGSAIFGLGDVGRAAVGQGAQLMFLKFSRDNETDADMAGLDLAARAGFDPRAGVALWQKMAIVNKAAPPQWLSTHPAGKNRIAEIRKKLPAVLPHYARAKGLDVKSLPPYRTNVRDIAPVS